MLNPLAACASLGFGILVSPEILIIGLILASDHSISTNTDYWDFQCFAQAYREEMMY